MTRFLLGVTVVIVVPCSLLNAVECAPFSLFPPILVFTTQSYDSEFMCLELPTSHHQQLITNMYIVRAVIEIPIYEEIMMSDR